MGKEVYYRLQPGQQLTEEQIAMIDHAKKKKPVYDADNPEADPDTSPELYAAMMNAVAERNRRIANLAKDSA